MTQLKSNLTLLELEELIGNVVAGSTTDYTFLDNPGVAYVSTHEAVAEKPDDIITFSKHMSERFTTLFDKKIKPFKYDNHTENAEYTIFNSLFTTQSGIVRILWLDNKILSIIVGSKPQRIFPPDPESPKKANKANNEVYSAHYFGLAEESDTNKALTDVNKQQLMKLPTAAWFVSDKTSGISQRHEDSCRSIGVSKNYVRWGSLEKFVGSDDINFLMYPRNSHYFFAKGGSYGSGIPGFVNLLGKFEYLELLDTKLLEADWNRYREYDNSYFMKDEDIIKEYSDKLDYIRFSQNSTHNFLVGQSLLKPKDLIIKKYSVLTSEDINKYKDNPRYNMVYSDDGLLFYVSKSDKLKATALQTKITKSMREEFIKFLNWIGYFQLVADLDPANMVDTFYPYRLQVIKNADWAVKALNEFPKQKYGLSALATEQYRTLYMGESTGSITPACDSTIFHTIFKQYSASSRYNILEEDPLRVLMGQYDLFSFNKKFSLNINLPSVLCSVARGNDTESMTDSSRMYFSSPSTIMSFLTTNFLLTDPVEKVFETVFKEDTQERNKQKTISHWGLGYNDNLKDGQLLKTCVTLSPEALAIFGSVATLSTPTDITSWLDLAKDHFTKVLPQQLYDKYDVLDIASAEQISNIITLGIEYYSTIFSAAIPFSNKLLSTDDSSDTGE